MRNEREDRSGNLSNVSSPYDEEPSPAVYGNIS
jgi:hypothetical protein